MNYLSHQQSEETGHQVQNCANTYGLKKYRQAGTKGTLKDTNIRTAIYLEEKC